MITPKTKNPTKTFFLRNVEEFQPWNGRPNYMAEIHVVKTLSETGWQPTGYKWFYANRHHSSQSKVTYKTIDEAISAYYEWMESWTK